MGTERNLCPNPACAVNSTGYSSTGTGWARSTSVDPGLPRTTGFEGTSVSDVVFPRTQVTPGVQYVASTSVKALAAQTIGIHFRWYTASSGGTLISEEATQSVTMVAGAVTRFSHGPYTAPAGAVSFDIKFNNIDAGGVEITALRATAYSGDLNADTAYFDGASPGATWDGTASNSTSARRTWVDGFASTDVISKTQTVSANSKTPTDSIAASDSNIHVAVSGAMADAFHAIDGFLVASLTFDSERGRVRLDAYTFAPSVTFARIYYRPVGGKYTLIRGGELPVYNGYLFRVADHYEYVAGVDSEYLIEGLTDDGVVVQRATVRRSGIGDKAWLKFVAAPRLNRRINLIGWGEIENRDRSTRFDVIGKSNPVYASDVSSADEVTIEIETLTKAETLSLRDALKQGQPIYLQLPDDVQLPSMYASVGTIKRRPAGRQNGAHTIFSLPLTEVDPPDFSITGSVRTYQNLLDECTTYEFLLNTYVDYQEVVVSDVSDVT